MSLPGGTRHGPSETGPPSGTAATDTAARQRFDPAFREAVAAGFLTPHQAYARGRREVYAQRLAARYALSAEAALAVADNRISLTEATAEERATTTPPETRVAAQSRSYWIKLASVALVLLAVSLVARRQGKVEELEPAPARAIDNTGSTSVVTDASGRVLRVVATSPADVLATYCDSTRGARFEALGVAPPTGESTAVRIGLLRDRTAQEKTLLALPIRADQGSARWYAGDGVHPLVPSIAPTEATAR